MSTTDSHVSRRDLLKQSAVAGAIFWTVPVIESITSQAAAQTPGLGLTCGQAFVFYQASNGSVFLVAFLAGSDGSTVGCEGTGAVNTCDTGTTITSPFNCLANGSFFLNTGGTGSSFPAATATQTNLPSGINSNLFSGSVTPAPGNGDCQGQFTISGGVVSTNPSNAILAAYAIPSGGCVPGTGGWMCPTTLSVANSIDLSSICG
jgi:hypothetical protein